MVFSERRKTLASSVGGCYSYSRGVQTERLLREQKHNFGACLSRQRYLPTNPKKTRVQNWTDLGSICSDSFHGILVHLASRPLFGVAWGIRPPASYNRNGLRLSRDTRERDRSPTSLLRMFRAGGLLGMIALLLRLSSIMHVIFL
jgi:hypothetical protein